MVPLGNLLGKRLGNLLLQWCRCCRVILVPDATSLRLHMLLLLQYAHFHRK
jgi:hypothetical protein